jgi:7,8-dihydropterin-6-yl-methyl-4-(beta-D-ribofuranosyl)aminobenzene 5'-phosphate synthase
LKRLVLLAILPCLAFAAEDNHRVHSLRIQLLSTMLADAGIGEWGFSAIVDVDGHRILFDTGARPDTVLINTNVLKVDLSNVDEVILTHNHDDHTGGLITLRKAYSEKNPAALAHAHVGKGIFDSRKAGSREGEGNPMIATRAAYEAGGGRFIVHDAPVELLPGVWLTGPVPRKYPEKNWSPGVLLNTSSGMLEDYLPEDQSLVFDTDQGLVLLSGCGHAGIVNTLEYARSVVRKAPVHAAIGGFHLFRLDEPGLEWTAGKLREFGLQNFMGAHCTGIEATYRIRQLAGLNRQTCSVGAVGGVFELGKKMDPGQIAR